MVLQRRADSLTTVVVTQDTFKEAPKGSGLLSCWENDNKKKRKKDTEGRNRTSPPLTLKKEKQPRKDFAWELARKQKSTRGHFMLKK